MTMGIPVDYLPVTLDGVLQTENHRHWLQFRVQQEQASGHKRPPQPLRAEEVEGLHLVEEEDEDPMEM
jgi:hypothetical protein